MTASTTKTNANNNSAKKMHSINNNRKELKSKTKMHDPLPNWININDYRKKTQMKTVKYLEIMEFSFFLADDGSFSIPVAFLFLAFPKKAKKKKWRYTNSATLCILFYFLKWIWFTTIDQFPLFFLPPFRIELVYSKF